VTSPRRAWVEAPAKVNLRLRVLHRRGDGFHELRTVFQALSLADEVTVTLERPPAPGASEGPGRAPWVAAGEGIHLQVGAEAPPAPDLGPPSDNLAVRAARAFREASGLREPLYIRLLKRIPAGGGLGGGSSDAAAVLRSLEALAEAGWAGVDGLGEAWLGRTAAALGSDVAFFAGSSALASATGRGELLHPLPPLPERELTLVLPPVHVATGPAYAALDRPLRKARREEESTPDEPRSALRPTSWDQVARHAHNDFQTVVALRHPEVARALTALEEAGGRPTLLSGSGAACFAAGLGPEAQEVLRRALGWTVLAVRTRTKLPEPRLDRGRQG